MSGMCEWKGRNVIRWDVDVVSVSCGTLYVKSGKQKKQRDG